MPLARYSTERKNQPNDEEQFVVQPALIQANANPPSTTLVAKESVFRGGRNLAKPLALVLAVMGTTAFLIWLLSLIAVQTVEAKTSSHT